MAEKTYKIIMTDGQVLYAKMTMNYFKMIVRRAIDAKDCVIEAYRTQDLTGKVVYYLPSNVSTVEEV